VISATLQKALDDRALHIVKMAGVECGTNKEYKIFILTALREHATTALNAELDGVE